MKESLIMKYVAEKLTKFDPAMKRAKEELGAECFLEVVKGTVVTELNPKFKAAIETVLKRRFNLKDHKCVFFNTPTVEQWIADLTGLLSEEDVYTVFAQSSGLSEEIFKTKTFGDNVLNIPFVMDIVEMLEGATGKKLAEVGYLNGEDSYAYANIAKFFATA